jgi:hypothetical protein
MHAGSLLSLQAPLNFFSWHLRWYAVPAGFLAFRNIESNSWSFRLSPLFTDAVQTLRRRRSREHLLQADQPEEESGEAQVRQRTGLC